MYQDHVPILNAGMRLDPDTFVRGVTFAFLSMRTQFIRVAGQMAEVDRAGSNARALWGFKRGAYDFLRLNKFDLHTRVVAATDSETAIAALTTIPGMGIVKSAFVCQMMGHDVGCLDTRNIKRLGLDPNEYKTRGEHDKTTAAFKRKVGRYVDATNGQAEALWNDWCEDVAKVYAVSGEDISRQHLVIVPKSVRRGLGSVGDVPVVVRHEIPFAA